MDILMLIMTIVLTLGLLILSIFLLTYFCLEDDKGFGSSLICKFAVVIGMSLSWAQVLCLPLDVSNARSGEGGFRMDILWQIIYIATAIDLIFVNPALSYYYEADEDDSFAQIPITAISCGLTNVQYSNSIPITLGTCLTEKKTLEINVSFPIYLIGIMSFISWFLFVVFGGIGLSALPMDLIEIFRTRPREMSKEVYEGLRNSVISRANQLRELGNKLKQIETENPNIQKATIFNGKKRKYNADLKKLKANCLVLENDHDIVKLQDFYMRKKIDLGFVYFYFCLFLGLICIILSILWVLHILLYIIIKFNKQPLYPFINNMLVYLQESYASFMAVIIFVVFCIYLLLATIKGSIKFGLRFACWTGFSFVAFIYLICRPSDRQSLEDQIGKNGPSEKLVESMQLSGIK